jgi:hypothetical protein
MTQGFLDWPYITPLATWWVAQSERAARFILVTYYG